MFFVSYVLASVVFGLKKTMFSYARVLFILPLIFVILTLFLIGLCKDYFSQNLPKGCVVIGCTLEKHVFKQDVGQDVLTCWFNIGVCHVSVSCKICFYREISEDPMKIYFMNCVAQETRVLKAKDYLCFALFPK